MLHKQVIVTKTTFTSCLHSPLSFFLHTHCAELLNWHVDGWSPWQLQSFFSASNSLNVCFTQCVETTTVWHPLHSKVSPQHRARVGLCVWKGWVGCRTDKDVLLEHSTGNVHTAVQHRSLNAAVQVAKRVSTQLERQVQLSPVPAPPSPPIFPSRNKNT